MREHSASVGSLEHPLLFQLSQIFANRYLAYFEQHSQFLDFDVPFVLEELQNSSSPCFRCHKPVRSGRLARERLSPEFRLDYRPSLYLPSHRAGKDRRVQVYKAASCEYLRNFDRAVFPPTFFGSQRQTERFQGVLRPWRRLPSL